MEGLIFGILRYTDNFNYVPQKSMVTDIALCEVCLCGG